MEYTTLANGVQMPMLGYGVFQIDNAQTKQCVAEAIESGYRLIDTAQAYGNEEGVGAAVKASGIDRGEFFITSKVWIANAGQEHAAASIDRSLQELGTDYIDLMLIHQPYGDYYGTWRAMEEAYRAGKLRAIGVSNFDAVRLIDLATFSDIVPMVDQNETHVFWQQNEARAAMKELGVQPMAWSPFAEGKNGFFTNPLLEEIGKAHGKSVAQVALRFLIQLGVVVIPKSAHRDRMEQNMDVFDFELSADEMARIATLDTGRSLVFDHSDVQLIGGLLRGVKASM